MVADPGTPRRSVESDPITQLRQMIEDNARDIAALANSASLRNASISGGDGLVVKDAAGAIRLKISTADAAIIAYDGTGAETSRYGLLSHSDPGQYGVEVLNAGSWVHIGAQVATWGSLSGKPATFPPSGHTHPGGDITSTVAQADGSQYGWTNTVAGSTFYALWVGNDGGYHFGRNTSSIRYKENVRDFHELTPGINSLRTVVYDRKDQWKDQLDDSGQPDPTLPQVLVPGATDEFGMIAEEVYKIWPEVVTMFDHEDGNGPQIDGIRYDLIGPRLIPTIQDQQRRLDEQDAIILALTARLDKLDGGVA